MSQPLDQNAKLQLSSLVDGELHPSEVPGLCAVWKDHEPTRRTWHTYQMIGDALRSEELAGHAGRDCDFMARLRQRLAEEPVVFAPQPAEEEFIERETAKVSGGIGVRSARRWRMPMTVAASVLAVSGVLMVARVSGFMPSDASSGGATGPLAAMQTPVAVSPVAAAVDGAGLRTVSTASESVDTSANSLSAVQPQIVVANRKVIRDARLDQYLAAHKQFGGSTALGVPSGFLSTATSESRDR